MARENMHQALEVYYEKVDHCPLRERQFNFFELVYVISGSGYYQVNGNSTAFAAGNLFLITPQDYHGFDLHSSSEFIVIHFGESYIREYQWKSIDHIECLLYHASHVSGSLLSNPKDQHLVNLLIDNLRQTIDNDSLYNEDLITHLVNAILVIAARNIALYKPQQLSSAGDIRILKIVDYIQANIFHPPQLKIAVIAAKFSLSPTYLGSYFQKQCNESLQHYISSYRIRLIEHRLQFSDIRVHELANEFGFTDESHINKFFKRHKGMSLKAYRIQKKMEL